MRRLVALLVSAAFPFYLGAQDEFSEATDAVNGFYHTIAAFLKVILCILFIYSLVKMIFSIQKGEEDSVKKLIWWMIAYAAGFILLDILVNLL